MLSGVDNCDEQHLVHLQNANRTSSALCGNNWFSFKESIYSGISTHSSRVPRSIENREEMVVLGSG